MASLHGYEILSDRRVERLGGARAAFGPIRVEAAAASPLGEDAEVVRLIAGADGTPSYALARTASRLIAWHADAGTFAIHPTERQIQHCSDDAAVPPGELRWGDRLGSTAIPLLAAELGGLALHAAANLVGRGCLLVCGVTGRGKSTMAAALAVRGSPLLAEDGVVVRWSDGEPVVWPGMRDVLITSRAAHAIGVATSGSAAPDRRGRILHPVPAGHGPAPVSAAVILAGRGGSRVAIERLPPARGHRELLAHALSSGRPGGAFAAAARLVEHVPVSLVTAPDRLDAVGDVVGELGRVGALG